MKLFLCSYFDQYCSLARYISIYIEKYFCKSISYKIVKKLSKKLSLNCQTFVKHLIFSVNILFILSKMVLSENEALLIGCNCYSFLKIASIMLFIFNQKEIQLEKILAPQY